MGQERIIWILHKRNKMQDNQDTDKTARRVSTLRTFGRSSSRRHLSLPRSSQTYTPSIGPVKKGN